MPMDSAQLTLAKLNSVLGGKGGEWGVEEPPAGAALPVAIRGKARELGNQGHTAAAVDLLLREAQRVQFRVPNSLLDEVEHNVLPLADNQATRASIGGALAGLRHLPTANAKTKGSFFSKLFGRK